MKTGIGCVIDESCRFFNPQFITIGDNVRIDAFTIITACERGVVIGDDVHIGVGCKIFGAHGRVVIENLAGMSANVCLYTATDDFTLGYLHNPNVPAHLKRITVGDVVLSEGSLVGCGSIVLPGVTLGRSAAVGALVVVGRDVGEGEVLACGKHRKVDRRRDMKLFESLVNQRNQESKQS